MSDRNESPVPGTADAPVIETERLILRHLTLDDAEFMLRLVNDPDWLAYIGDRGVRSLDDARDYLAKGPLDSYAKRGFGLDAIVPKALGRPVGICGLIKRDFLEHFDLGFAMLPEGRGAGYAREAARAVLAHARDMLALARVEAFTVEANGPSRSLLENLGFRFERVIADPRDGADVLLYVWSA